MNWHRSNRGDRMALPLADRHYNRQKPGTPQFVKPGACRVFLTSDESALWVSSFQRPDLVKHAWAGCWENSIFRNEGPVLSSQLIREGVAATLHDWGTPPPGGIITFVDPKKIKAKRDPGYCYIRAGFVAVGWTAGGLIVLQLSPAAMPNPEPPLGAIGTLFAGLSEAGRNITTRF